MSFRPPAPRPKSRPSYSPERHRLSRTKGSEGAASPRPAAATPPRPPGSLGSPARRSAAAGGTRAAGPRGPRANRLSGRRREPGGAGGERRCRRRYTPTRAAQAPRAAAGRAGTSGTRRTDAREGQDPLPPEPPERPHVLRQRSPEQPPHPLGPAGRARGSPGPAPTSQDPGLQSPPPTTPIGAPTRSVGAAAQLPKRGAGGWLGVTEEVPLRLKGRGGVVRVRRHRLHPSRTSAATPPCVRDPRKPRGRTAAQPEGAGKIRGEKHQGETPGVRSED